MGNSNPPSAGVRKGSKRTIKINFPTLSAEEHPNTNGKEKKDGEVTDVDFEEVKPACRQAGMRRRNNNCGFCPKDSFGEEVNTACCRQG